MRAEDPYRPLSTRASFDDALTLSESAPVVLYKHSATCGLSTRADAEMRRLAASGDVPVYRLTVQASRPLSSEIARRLNVRHETPQVLVVHRGRVVYHASHVAVQERAVREACEEAAAGHGS